jgi:riboflavin kinase/FMN adenylyltransferase
MRLIRHWQAFPEKIRSNGTVVMIGSFDGLHIGHQGLIKLAKQQASALHLPVVLVTFEPSPKHYFLKKSQGQINKLLCFYDKYKLLEKMGVDYLVVLKFNKEMLNLTPEDFLDKLNLYIQPKAYCLGQDFRFGKNRAGDIFTLQKYARLHNQLVGLLPTIEDTVSTQGSIRVSSTLLRASLGEGDLKTAKRILNRSYTISGKVSPGKKLGRTIGVRTANINLKCCPIPLRGVYAVRVCKIGDVDVNYPGVANIGIRPTVHQDKQLTLEVHIFDENLELYGKRIEIEFVQKIRDEKKFEDINALKKQIDEDAKQARLIV